MSNIPRTGLNKPKTKKEIQNKKCYPLQFWSLRAERLRDAPRSMKEPEAMRYYLWSVLIE